MARQSFCISQKATQAMANGLCLKSPSELVHFCAEVLEVVHALELLTVQAYSAGQVRLIEGHGLLRD